ncbi:MAG TPA: hypothetical protein VL068_04945 [Microthrixaceae bacterium]|nr:hypothetical protein [Microthrixaceae bacterium]
MTGFDSPVTGSQSTGSLEAEMSTDPATPTPKQQHRELPVEELLRRVRPMPPPEEFVIEDLTPEEGEAFLEAVRS